jgi:hypothetical protein
VHEGALISLGERHGTAAGAVEICPVNFPSPLAGLRAEQSDCARAVATNSGVKNIEARIAAKSFFMVPSDG